MVADDLDLAIRRLHWCADTQTSSSVDLSPAQCRAVIEALNADADGSDTTLSAEIERLRSELAALGNSAVDGLLIGHVIHPHNPSEPLPPERMPYTREDLEHLLHDVQMSELPFTWTSPFRLMVFRLLATVEQRDRIYHAIRTDADPAGTAREVVELRDHVAQLTAKIEELHGESA